jgi:hypothetical protein
MISTQPRAAQSSASACASCSARYVPVGLPGLTAMTAPVRSVPACATAGASVHQRPS